MNSMPGNNGVDCIYVMISPGCQARSGHTIRYFHNFTKKILRALYIITLQLGYFLIIYSLIHLFPHWPTVWALFTKVHLLLSSMSWVRGLCLASLPFLLQLRRRLAQWWCQEGESKTVLPNQRACRGNFPLLWCLLLEVYLPGRKTSVSV